MTSGRRASWGAGVRPGKGWPAGRVLSESGGLRAEDGVDRGPRARRGSHAEPPEGSEL